MSVFSFFKEVKAAIDNRGIEEDLKKLEEVFETMHADGKLPDSLYSIEEKYKQLDSVIGTKNATKDDHAQYQTVTLEFMKEIKNFDGFDTDTKALVDKIVTEYNAVASAGEKPTA